MNFQQKKKLKGNIDNVIKAHRVRSPSINPIHAERYLHEQFRATFDPPTAQTPFEIHVNYVFDLSYKFVCHISLN